MNNILLFISNHLLLSTTWFFLLMIIIILFFNTFNLKAKVINNFDAIKLINKKNANIIDTRSIQLYDEGHILNAIHFPLKDISFKTVQELNISSIEPVILIMNSSESINKYIQKFKHCGINDIYILKNGMNAWNRDKLPVFVNKKNNY